MNVIIDRFEGDIAVVEAPDGCMHNIPASLLPGAAEGDVIRIEKDSSQTAMLKNEISSLEDELFI